MSQNHYPQSIIHGVIKSHQELISKRYQYDQLKLRYNPPDWISKEKVDNLRNYFLSYIYPPIEKREELNAAFHSLDDHIKNPQHLLRIFLDSSSLIFKYGRHLPKILMAGLKAMGSFRSASNMENQLAHVAKANNMNPPYSLDQIKIIMSKTSHEYMDEVLESSLDLYDILNDEKLVNKIILLVNDLLDKMNRKLEVYSASEIKGIELGRDIILGSIDMFYQFERKERQVLFDLILEIEQDAIAENFSLKSK